ncbi:hypothetical protein [Oleiharenicola lentus]|uniref:hypothetical protein n=1 Tax=Oleiharenicola lentus TaxID=2508720 RepID=UPI003F6706B1
MTWCWHNLTLPEAVMILEERAREDAARALSIVSGIGLSTAAIMSKSAGKLYGKYLEAMQKRSSPFASKPKPKQSTRADLMSFIALTGIPFQQAPAELAG